MPLDPPAPQPAPIPPDDVEAVYDELRALAARKLAGEPPGQTLQATALVHEAWIKLAAGTERTWNGPTHFYAAAARAMRQILIDNARRKQAVRHGGGWLRLETQALDGVPSPQTSTPEQVEALGMALDRLALTHPVHAELVQRRFFIGLSLKEAANTLGISEPTAKRYWAFARAWLFRELQSVSAAPEPPSPADPGTTATDRSAPHQPPPSPPAPSPG